MGNRLVEVEAAVSLRLTLRLPLPVWPPEWLEGELRLEIVARDVARCGYGHHLAPLIIIIGISFHFIHLVPSAELVPSADANRDRDHDRIYHIWAT